MTTLRLVVLRSCVAAFVISIGLWLGSYWPVVYSTANCHFGIALGAVGHVSAPHMDPGWHFFGFMRFSPGFYWPIWNDMTKVVPLWIPALLCGVWPACVLIRRRRRPREGCPDCGYDLRATPERCPECGHQVEAT